MVIALKDKAGFVREMQKRNYRIQVNHVAGDVYKRQVRSCMTSNSRRPTMLRRSGEEARSEPEIVRKKSVPIISLRDV